MLFLRGGPAAWMVQEAIAAPGFEPMNMGKETTQQLGTAQVRQLPSTINTHLQEPALRAKGPDRAERGQGLQREELAEDRR